MFKSLHFKSFLLFMLAMFIGGVNSAWAEDVTIGVGTSSITWTADGNNYQATSGDFTLRYEKGSYSNSLSGGLQDEELRLYSGTNFVVSSTKTITKIVYTVADGSGKNYSVSALSTADGHLVSGVWTGSANSVSASLSAQNRIKSVTITYEGSDPSDTRAATTVTIDATSITNTNIYEGTAAGSLSATVKAGDDAVSGASVTWSSDDTDVATIDASTGVVTLVGAGSTIITASFAGDETNYKPSTDTYELTVTNTDPNAPGTENNPYTVAQAIQNTPSSSTSADVYIKGIVSKFYKTDIVSDGTNYRYYISDDGTETNQLLVYKGKGLNNVAFSSANDLQIGDEVVILGGLTTYNSTKEVAANNYIVSLNRKPAPTIKLVDEDETEVEDELNVQFDGQKGLDVYCFANDVDITNDVEITWTSADETIATYDGAFVNGLAMGTTTITFNFAGNADYRPVSKVLTVNVEDARTPVTLTFGEVPSSINVGETASYPIEQGFSVTYTSSDDNIVSVDEDGEITANAVGTATIFATFAGDADYKPATDSYTITVVDPNAPTTVYKKVTSTADITDGEYLIVYEGGVKQGEAVPAVAFDGSLTTLDAVGNGVPVTINAESNEITGSTTIDAAVFTIDVTTGTLWSASGLYIGVGSNSNGLKQSTKPDAYTHTFAIDDSGNAVIAAVFESSTMTLRYNYASNQLRFRYYKDNGQEDIALYKKIATLPVTITSAGAASFSSKYALDFSKVEGLKAYKATSKSDSYVHLDEVEQVPAGAGVIVKGNEGTYNVPVATGDVAELEGNKLVGTVNSTFTVEHDDYGKVYKYVKASGVVGFQKAKEGWTCQAGHAYLYFPETQAREFIGIFDEDISTGINAIDNSQLTIDNDAPAYNLAGQKVGKGYKGIVVKNGKKYVK